MSQGLIQLGIMAAEAVLTAVLVLFLFRLRRRLGLSPLFIAVGSFQFLQVVLALSIYVEVLPGILISPGSAVLFTSTLFAVLLVYMQEDAGRARELIYGVVIANIALGLLSGLFGLHLASPVSHNFYDLPAELFFQNWRVLLVGTVALFLDVVLIIIAYEAVSRLLPRSLFLRVLTAMCGVLALDSLIFVGGNFLGRPEFGSILLSSLFGKFLAALLFSAMIAIYFRTFRRSELETELAVAERRDIFEVLTYRQRYERMRERVARDPLTGLFNRGFFDEVLPLELARSARSGHPTSLFLADLDHFKKVNDQFGHQEGDRVLREVGAALKESLRSADAACRIGGEEFAVILPHAAGAAARQTAERLRRRLSERVAHARPPLAAGRVTLTVGIASYPDEASTAEELIRLADRRLYRGKRAGRDRVVGGIGGRVKVPL